MRVYNQISIAFAVMVPVCLVMAFLQGISGFETFYNLVRSRHNPRSSHESERLPELNSIGGGFDENFSSVFKSIFPMDLVMSYNTSNSSSHDIVARYASFSNILTHEIRGNYAIMPGNACQKVEWDRSYSDKVLIVQRGECSFVDKVQALLDSDLSPRAIVIANNIPQNELITMYHRSFNHDGEIKTPMMFMSLEDYEVLASLESRNITLSLSTMNLDSIMGISLSMALSPPMLFLLFYLTIRIVQYCRSRRVSYLNERYVAQLPVYMYKGNHLIPCSRFYEYLEATHQTEDVPFTSSSSEDLAVEDTEITPIRESLVVNGTDLYSLSNMGLLFSKTDYYATSKCSICLGRLVPLHSRVLLLQCKHIFHEKCLSNWLINFKKSCPLCNQMIRLGSEPRSYGTFGRDLEAAFPEDMSREGSVTSRANEEMDSNENSIPAQAISFPPHTAHSYSSMPILPNRSAAGVSASMSTVSALSYVTTASQSMDLSEASVASEYLTPTGSLTSLGEEPSEASHSANSTISFLSHH